jgi:SAM-dependent methyltransferase
LTVNALLGGLGARSPRVKRVLWRTWYELLASRYRQPDWTFMNYGYAPLNPADPVPAAECSRPSDRISVSLYHRAVEGVELERARVLEVGSGRGGGCAYLAHRSRASVLGVDFSALAVDFCRKTHRYPNLDFRRGDAEALPCADRSFDVVVNVESSHCYRSFAGFASEVFRVLDFGGRLCWADLGPPERLDECLAHFQSAGFAVERRGCITPNVVRALELMSEDRLSTIRQLVPKPFVRAIGDFAGLPGSRVYAALASGEVRYTCAVLLKPPSKDPEVRDSSTEKT